MVRMHEVIAVLLASTMAAATMTATAACSGTDDPSSKDEGAAVTGDTPKDSSGKSAAPAPTSDKGGPSLGGDYHQLLGAWIVKGTNGPIRAAVFEDEAAKPEGHAFFADLFGSPTSSGAVARVDRVTGSFNLTKDFILISSDDAEIDGAFRYNFVSPNVVVVAEPKGPVTYERVTTYCDAVADCDGQDYPHPECWGFPTCVTHACGWTCGAPSGK